MSELLVAGCRTTPLGGYLQALGLLRAVARLLDENATGRWERQSFVLGCRFADLDALVEALVEGFRPEPIVSPWNSGSGFAGNGKSPKAEDVLQRIRASTDPWLTAVRDAALAGDRIVATGRARGWGGSADKLWEDKHKVDVLRLCRAELPDEALPWLDAAVALGQDSDPAYSRLLGTGGNLGRQDLSSTYLRRALSVLDGPRSRPWLRAALVGDETVPYLRETVGQFDPGRAGGIQSSPWEKADEAGFLNPWAYLLTVEGTLLFAGAVVRRHGAQHARAALPFQVRGATAGFSSAAGDETPLGELWTPEWSEPVRLAELAHLLAEGRAEWNGRPARSGLDFVRAVASLGVDRGIAAFHRNVFVDRHGQNPLAVPAGRVAVSRRGPLQLLAPLDGWVDRVRAAAPPATVDAALRRLDEALFTMARRGGSDALVDVFAALGVLHEAVAHSGAVRERVPPLVLPKGRDLVAELLAPAAADPALRLALALATARDTDAATLGGLRPLLSPVHGEASGRRPQWSSGPGSAALGVGLLSALTEAARRRAFPGAVPDVDGAAPAVLGARTAFRRGCQLRVGDGASLLAGGADRRRTAELLAGLLTVDWTGTRDAQLDGPREASPDPARDLLVCFAGVASLRVPTEDDGGPVEVWLRPAANWPSALAAGHTADVLADAARRLRISGLRFVVDPTPGRHEPAFLTALLLLPTTDAERMAALRRVAVIPDPVRVPENQETTA